MWVTGAGMGISTQRVWGWELKLLPAQVWDWIRLFFKPGYWDGYYSTLPRPYPLPSLHPYLFLSAQCRYFSIFNTCLFICHLISFNVILSFLDISDVFAIPSPNYLVRLKRCRLSCLNFDLVKGHWILCLVKYSCFCVKSYKEKKVFYQTSIISEIIFYLLFFY